MRVLICGDRDWKNYECMRRVLYDMMCNGELSFGHDTLIHGDARGVDKMSAQFFENIEVYPADWEQHGKAAGPIRNQQMLDTGVDMVIAFHSNISESKGTLDMIKRANKAGVEVRLYSK